MMTILWFLGYLLIGLIAIFATVLVHLIRAELKNYCAVEWWSSNYDLKHPLATDEEQVQFVFGLIVWPMRLYAFINLIPELYNSYDIRVN